MRHKAIADGSVVTFERRDLQESFWSNQRRIVLLSPGYALCVSEDAAAALADEIEWYQIPAGGVSDD